MRNEAVVIGAGMAVTLWYQRRLFRAAQVSPEVVTALARVQHLLTPGSTLLRPAMIGKALRAAHRARKAAATRPAPSTAPTGSAVD